VRKLIIHLINGALLVIVLIGVPSITSRHVAGVAVSSTSKMQLLTLWGLGIAAAANMFLALFGGLKQPVRKLLFLWCVAFSAILLLEVLHFQGVIHFRWLKELLLWVQESLRARS
jgi:hypothetical protein